MTVYDFCSVIVFSVLIASSSVAVLVSVSVLLFRVFSSLRCFWRVTFHHGLFSSFGLFFLFGQHLSKASSSCFYHSTKHLSNQLVVIFANNVMFFCANISQNFFQLALCHLLEGGISIRSTITSNLMGLWSEKLISELTLQFVIDTASLLVKVIYILDWPIVAWNVGIFSCFSTLLL